MHEQTATSGAMPSPARRCIIFRRIARAGVGMSSNFQLHIAHDRTAR